MKKIFRSLTFLATAIIAITSCDSSQTSSITVDLPAEVCNFVIDVPSDITFIQSETPSIVMTGKEKSLERIKSTTNGDKIEIFSNHKNSRQLGKVDIYIYTPTISRIEVTGAADIDTKGAITCPSLSIAVNGAGDIDIDEALTVDGDLTISVSGAGDVDLANVTVGGMCKVSVSGAGDISLAGSAPAADIRITGAGNVKIRNFTCPNLSTDISGAGVIKR